MQRRGVTRSAGPGDDARLSDSAERDTAAKALDRCLAVEAGAERARPR